MGIPAGSRWISHFDQLLRPFNFSISEKDNSLVLLGEPTRTQYDLNFSIFGFPVRVHPMFWLVSVVLGLSNPLRISEIIIWVAAVFVSILIHELGHAFAIRKFGGRCWITLYGMGGLASSDSGNRSSREQIMISAAGPVAGFLFVSIILALVHLSGNEVFFVRGSIMPIQFSGIENVNLGNLVWDLIWINFAWGFINLLPVYPLDGGQIAREILIQKHPSRGIVQSLWLSVFTAGCLALFALVGGEEPRIYIAMMFGYLGYSSYATLQAYTGRGGPSGW